MLTKTLSEAKKKQRNILIKAMNNDIGSIDSAEDSWNPAQISERAKDISYIRNLVDTWNPAQLNEALRMFDLPVIDTWNPAQIEEQRRNLVFYLTERTLTGNPITLNILGNLTPEVTGLKVSMSPIQDLNGYDYPWVGGAGKNKAVKGVTGIKNQVTFTVADDGKITTSGTPSASDSKMISSFTLSAGTWCVSGCPSGGGSGRFGLGIYNTLSGTNLAIDYGSGESFTLTESTEVDLKIRYWYGYNLDNRVFVPQVESGSTPTSFAPYENICPISGRNSVTVTRTAGEDVETHTHTYSSTVYGGVDDFVSGEGESEWGYIASYNGETLPGEWISDRDVYAPETTPTTGAEVAYKLATPTTIETTPEEITLLKGTNVLSTDGDSIELKYKQNF